MAKAKEFNKCALVVAILSTSEDRHQELVELLQQNFGPVECQSAVLDFKYTDYYDQEMSGRPVRYFLLFKNAVDPSRLAKIKTITNSIEQSFADANGRRINIDPGILSLANFILATCKDRSHRIPLSDGIYGEVTLIYQDKMFNRLPWTYADYSSQEVMDILCHFRDLYKKAR